MSFKLLSKATLFLVVFSLLGTLNMRAAGHSLVVAYIDGDTLFSWQEGATTPRTIAKGNIAHPLLSPDTTQIIFQQDKDLWIAALANTDKPAKTLVTADTLDVAPDKARFVLDAEWLDSKTVLFNTYHYHPNTLVQQVFADDLWQVNTATGKVMRLLSDGSGGAFSISPDGKHIAVIRAGDYANNTPGSITVVDSSGQNALKFLEFPVINTGASYQFYPQPRWKTDSSGLFVAIPDPNLIYATGNVPPTRLWKLDLSGAKTQVGAVKANFFGLPQFSPDGKYILYAQRIGAVKDNQIALFYANSDGTGQQEIVRDAIGTLEPARWLPTSDAYTFIHGKPGELWLANAADNSVQRFPNGSTLVFGLSWIDSATYVYETSPGGTGEIRTGTYGAKSEAIVITKCSACGELDARYRP